MSSAAGREGDPFLPASDAEQAVTRPELASNDLRVPTGLVGTRQVNSGDVDQALAEQRKRHPAGALERDEPHVGRAGQLGGEQPHGGIAARHDQGTPRVRASPSHARAVLIDAVVVDNPHRRRRDGVKPLHTTDLGSPVPAGVAAWRPGPLGLCRFRTAQAEQIFDAAFKCRGQGQGSRGRGDEPACLDGADPAHARAPTDGPTAPGTSRARCGDAGYRSRIAVGSP